jgi:uncharacterized membrane protein (UPF0127 family)
MDVYWLDQNFKILHKETMKPWRFSKTVKCKYILESEVGKFDKIKGDSFHGFPRRSAVQP